MKRTILKFLAIGMIGLPVAAFAVPIQVTYDVGAHNPGGFSASWLHAADDCPNIGPSGNTLFMCGDAERITGTITGMYDDALGELTINSGILTTAGGVVYNSISGSLGGGGAWQITIGGLGSFLFEGFDWGDSLPNNFDGSEFILWGQNEAAYDGCNQQNEGCGTGRRRWGLDLYGAARVPEPGTLALFGIGLLGLGVAKRRRA